ncbi:MAG: hypothetical protein ABSH10_06665, partial [Phycisphaerae bacterium]
TGVGGGCSVPLGVNARLSGDRVTLHAVFGDDDGAIIFKERAEGPREEADLLVSRLLEGLRLARRTGIPGSESAPNASRPKGTRRD